MSRPDRLKMIKQKCSLIEKCLPTGQFKYVIGGMFSDLIMEIERLERVAVEAHDSVLRRDSDLELMNILKKAWGDTK